MTIGVVQCKPERMSKIGTPGGKRLYEVKDRSTNFIHVELVDQQILPLFTPGTIVVVEIRSEERIGVIRTASYKGAAALFTLALLLWQEDEETMTFKDEEVTPQMIRMQVSKRHVITMDSLVTVVFLLGTIIRNEGVMFLPSYSAINPCGREYSA